jgi:hydroxymethylglutaryl-CoA lyase
MQRIIFSDVTARDGLQSLKTIFNVEQRTRLIKQLSKCFFSEIEVGSLVNPKIIPTMANSLEVYKNTINKNQFKSFVLVGNNRNIKEINENKIKYFSLFSSPSNEFNKHNINTDVDGSFERFRGMLDLLEDRSKHHIKGYISCIGDCPYEGNISVDKTLYAIEKYQELGVDEICIADTIGTMQPNKLRDILTESKKMYDHSLLSLHLHTENELTTDVWKRNLEVSLENKIFKYDTSLLGIGGCPAAYSKDDIKTGNLNIIYASKFFKDLGFDVGNIGTPDWYTKIYDIEKEWKPLMT